MIDEIVSKTFKLPSNANIGDGGKYDKSSLKAYVYESKLKRVIVTSTDEVKEYLKSKFNISDKIRVKSEVKDEDGNSQYEEFDVIDNIKSKLIGMDSKTCLKLWEIYEEKGLHSLINAIQFLSPIQRI